MCGSGLGGVRPGVWGVVTQTLPLEAEASVVEGEFWMQAYGVGPSRLRKVRQLHACDCLALAGYTAESTH